MAGYWGLNYPSSNSGTLGFDMSRVYTERCEYCFKTGYGCSILGQNWIVWTLNFDNRHSSYIEDGGL